MSTAENGTNEWPHFEVKEMKGKRGERARSGQVEDGDGGDGGDGEERRTASSNIRFSRSAEVLAERRAPRLSCAILYNNNETFIPTIHAFLFC